MLNHRILKTVHALGRVGGCFVAFIEEGENRQEPRSGPKLFTEYSLSALLVIVGLIGSFMTILTLASTVLLISWLMVITSVIDPILTLSAICSLAMIPLGAYQVYQAYQLHKKSIHNFKTMQMIAGLNVVFSIVQAAAFGSVLLVIGLIMLYAFGGVIVFNLIIVYFLNQSEVRQEFEE